ncbi:MAG: hypothetical protein KDC61_10380 [Saprospiraceae bacterium]|nr:hypothetical protein [Saprospiraceae bacterium]MCB0574957.1 hypothetical protein [Saprospiraceae bacterium]MCB9355693.1 hypothetical protein [Lewinellaceae bacterium]
MSRKDPHPESELHSNKVYQALRYLESAEHKRLLKYLYSPYFNQSKTLTSLCEILLAHIEKGKPGFNREKVWKALFPKEPFDDVNFRKYCSDLLKLVGQFMAQELISQDRSRQSIDVLDFVVQRKLEPLFNGALRQARSDLERISYRSLEYYYKAYSIERNFYTMMDFDVKLDVRSNVEDISNNLDLFYWIEKIKLYIAVISQKKTRTHQYDLKFINEVVSYLRNYPIEDVPALAIYYYALMTLLEEDDVDHYYNLRRILNRYIELMPQHESIEIIDSVLHYCTGKINQGNRAFLQEYFEVCEEAVQKGVFLFKGELAPWRFNNIIAAALRLGKLEWAESFAQDYMQFLPKDSRQNAYTFNLARVYLYQKKYDKVLDLLRDIEYEDIGYNLISKAILTITYYELDELDALDSFTESFRVFLNRHKNIPQQLGRSYLNLVKYVRRITRLAPGDKASVEKLREEIVREKASTVNHEWLLEKLDALG